MFQILDITSICTRPEILPVLTIAKRVLDLIQLFGPILLIVSLIINFSQMMMNPEDKKLPSKIKNSVIALLFVFAIPILVNATFKLLDGQFSLATCWNQVGKNTKVIGNADDDNDPDLGADFDKMFLPDPEEYEKGSKKESNESGESSETPFENDASGSAADFINALQKISSRVESDAKSGNYWKYSVHNNQKSYPQALKKKHSTNCALYVVWALKEINVLKPGQAFYKGYKNGKNFIHWNDSTRTRMNSLATVIDAHAEKASTLIRNGQIKPGDILLWYNRQHTNVYAGNNMFYDAGTSKANGIGPASNHKFKTLGPMKHSHFEHKVWKIIRLK